MKNQTRMATALAATLLLSAHVVSAQEAAQPNPESGKPGFFRQLGKGLKDAGGQMIGVKPTAASGTQSAGNEAIYTPVSGAGKIQGLFKSDNHQLAQQGRLDWPRVALTFQEWGGVPALLDGRSEDLDQPQRFYSGNLPNVRQRGFDRDRRPGRHR